MIRASTLITGPDVLYLLLLLLLLWLSLLLLLLLLRSKLVNGLRWCSTIIRIMSCPLTIFTYRTRSSMMKWTLPTLWCCFDISFLFWVCNSTKVSTRGCIVTSFFLNFVVSIILSFPLLGFGVIVTTGVWVARTCRLGGVGITSRVSRSKTVFSH